MIRGYDNLKACALPIFDVHGKHELQLKRARPMHLSTTSKAGARGMVRNGIIDEKR